jgi:electron transport complex protein RnfC
MGGASFPTHVKLAPPPEKKIDTLILNGAECEPFLTADHRLMLEDPHSVLTGAAIVGKILGIDRLFIGIETNKINAMEELQKYAGDYGIDIVPLKVQYPQGSEKQLIQATTGREVPAGGLPMDARCVVQNTGTAAAVADAVLSGLPLIERITTVTGQVVRKPGNWKLRIGTPVIEAIRLAEGVTGEPGKLILGGPMMGFAQSSLDVTVSKNTSGVVLLGKDEVRQFESGPCLSCGRCVESCPMRLLVSTLSKVCENERYDLAQENHVMTCLECGICTYVCPAGRPNVQHFRRAKFEIRQQNKRK